MSCKLRRLVCSHLWHGHIENASSTNCLGWNDGNSIGHIVIAMQLRAKRTSLDNCLTAFDQVTNGDLAPFRPHTPASPDSAESAHLAPRPWPSAHPASQ